MTTIRCSNADRVLACPASLTIVPLVEPQGDTSDSVQGSGLHQEIASRLCTELGATTIDGKTIPPLDKAATRWWSPFSEWVVKWAVRHIREIIPTNMCLLVEVPLAYEIGEGVALSGHPDVMGISETEAIAVDWKTGRDPVDPADSNEQVACYDALIKTAWPSVRKIRFDIAQPLSWAEDTDPISTSVVEGESLDQLPGIMAARFRDALTRPFELNSGPKQCRYCPAKLQCPAIIADRELMKLTLTEQQIAAIRATPDDKLLADWVIAMRSLNSAGKQAEELIRERLASVGTVYSSNMVKVTAKTQRGAYTVPDPVAFYEAVRQLLPESSIPKVMEPSMTAIKDELATVNDIPKTGKSAVTAESVFDAHLRPLVQQGTRTILVFQ